MNIICGAIIASAKEAALITETAHRDKQEVIDWCGGTYSSEWGFSKLLHWLRNNPDKRERFASALEHCDMVAAVLMRNHRSGEGAAVDLRDGAQVDVEFGAGWIAGGGISDDGRSVARRRAREIEWAIRGVATSLRGR